MIITFNSSSRTCHEELLLKYGKIRDTKLLFYFDCWSPKKLWIFALSPWFSTTALKNCLEGMRSRKTKNIPMRALIDYCLMMFLESESLLTTLGMCLDKLIESEFKIRTSFSKSSSSLADFYFVSSSDWVSLEVVLKSRICSYTLEMWAGTTSITRFTIDKVISTILKFASERREIKKSSSCSLSYTTFFGFCTIAF